jgi:hypothetical protein
MSKFASHARLISRKTRSRDLIQLVWTQVTFSRVLFVTLGIPLAIYLLTEVKRSVVVLDTIAAPKYFADSGLSSEALTRRVRQRLEEIERTDEEASPKAQLSTESNHELPDIEIPDTKISLQVVGDVLRKILGNEEKHLSGEIIYPNRSGKVEVRASMFTSGQFDQPGEPRELETTDIGDIVDALAPKLMELDDPFLLGMYLRDRKDLPAAFRSCGENALRLAR